MQLILQSILFTILGAVSASFLACAAERWRAEEPLWDRSRCEGCGRPLAPRQLLPVLGYVLARGRCPHCGYPIPRRYPFLELCSGGVLCAYALHFDGRTLWALLLPLPALFLIAYEDGRIRLVDDRLQIAFAATALASALLLPGGPGLVARGLAALVYGGVLWLLARWQPEGLGEADILFVAIAAAGQGPLVFSRTFLLGVGLALAHGLWLGYRARCDWRAIGLPLLAYLAPAYVLTPLWLLG